MPPGYTTLDPRQGQVAARSRRVALPRGPRRRDGQDRMIKRRLGSALRARTYWSQCREIILRVITHNVMIITSG